MVYCLPPLKFFSSRKPEKQSQSDFFSLQLNWRQFIPFNLALGSIRSLVSLGFAWTEFEQDRGLLAMSCRFRNSNLLIFQVDFPGYHMWSRNDLMSRRLGFTEEFCESPSSGK